MFPGRNLEIYDQNGGLLRIRRRLLCPIPAGEGAGHRPGKERRYQAMSRYDDAGVDTSYKDLLVLSIVPVVVAVLTLLSWALAHWEIGPLFVNAGVALIATLFGGFQRFVSGFRDIFNRKITVNVFVVVALTATIAVGEFRAAAVIVFIMAVAGALESYTLDKTKKSIRSLLDFAPKMATIRSEEHTSELQSHSFISYAVFCLKKKKSNT